MLNTTTTIGPDRAKFRIRTEGENDTNKEPIDEIEEYWSGRYLSSPEAVWRIMGYNITLKTPAVTALPVHLPNSFHHKRYHRSNSSQTLSNLEHYFARPEGVFLDGTDQREFKDLCVRATLLFSSQRAAERLLALTNPCWSLPIGCSWFTEVESKALLPYTPLKVKIWR